ncbi:MAG: metallophosphoesterase [Tannerella sp.]|nr:metallophosphoesterase [Tannerella sp.]
MDRRIFFKSSYGFAGLLACHHVGMLSCVGNNTKIRFGIVTDLHYARRPVAGTRYYEHSINKLREAVNVFNKSDLDFIIELGDFKDAGSNREETLSFLDEIECEYRKFHGPVYHVFGNHDMDSISKEDFLKHTANEGKAKNKTYYSFVRREIKFIVLDANYNADGSDYNCGNFDWKVAHIPQMQLDWLSQELETEQPVIVFLHQLLDITQQHHHVCVTNAQEVTGLLEKNNHVLAVFQGHHHTGSYHLGNGIHYFTLKGMIEGAFPESSSFAVVEIDNSCNITIDGFHNCEDTYLRKS